MASKNPALATLADNIKQGIANRIKDLHTSMPGIIESFDPETQTASVQPAIRRIFVRREGTDEILVPEDLSILINVPVQFPRGGGFSLTFPVKKGDECLIVFAERAIDRWHKFGGVRDPNARRFHSLSDATVFVGISSLPNKVPNYDGTNTQLKKDDGTAVISVNEDSSISVEADSNIDVTSQSDVNVQCENLTANANAAVDITAGTEANVTATTAATVTAPTITLNGNVVITGSLTQGGGGGGTASLSGGLEVTGTMTNNGKDVGDTHSHAQGDDSGGDTQQNISGVL